MKAIINKSFAVTSGLFFLMVLSGCDWFSKKDDQKINKGAQQTVQEEKIEAEVTPVSVQNVLLSIEGKPVITVTEFEGHLKKIIDSNPQLSSVIESVPAMKYNIFSGMMSQELLRIWVKKSKIAQTDQYKKDLEMMTKIIEYELARKYFQDDVQKTVKVSASDVKAYYDRNKANIPDILLAPGGVKAMGIAFEHEWKANQFLQTMGQKDNFEKHAKAEKLDLVDFGLVTQYSVDVDKQIKGMLAGVNNVPKIIRVKEDDKKYWVFLATEKQEPEYRPLAEVQEGIEQTLRNEKGHVMFGQKIEVLKTVYRAQENKNYFDKQSVQEMLEQEQQAGPEPIKAQTTSRVA
jgi:hypothetical protein